MPRRLCLVLCKTTIGLNYHPNWPNAYSLHLRAEELRRQMELTYRERDLLVKPIKEAVMASRDLLLGAYRANPKKLGDWGFEVSDRPATRVVAPAEPMMA
jgi:hypothetical protein